MDVVAAFAFYFVAFRFVYREAGVRANVWTTSASASLPAALTAAHAELRDGYASVGAGGAAGWLAVLHLVLLPQVVLYGTYVVRRFEAAPPPPFLSPHALQLLARRPRFWRRSRALAVGSAVLVVLAGAAWDELKWVLAVTAAAAAAAVCGAVLAPAAAKVRRRRARSVRPFFARVDRWGIAQLRVAERQGEHGLLLVDDLIRDMRRRLDGRSPRYRRYGAFSMLLLTALLLRYRLLGQRRDLDSALETGRRLLASRPPEDAARNGYAIQYATALHVAYTATGDLDMIDESIRILREAAGTASPAVRPLVLAELAVALDERVLALDDVDALRESIGLHRRAVAETPTEDYQSVLRRALVPIFSPFTRPRTRKALREAVGVALVNSHHLPQRLSNLGLALVLLYGVDEDPALLTEAVEVMRRALRVMPAGHTQRPLVEARLADALLVKQDAEGGDALLDEAEPLLRRSLDGLAEGHPQRAEFRYLLGTSARRRFDATGDVAQRERAIEQWRQAAHAPAAPAWVRGGSAEAWGHLAAESGDWESALEAFSLAVETLPQRASRALSRPERERALTRPKGLAADAAAAALSAGRPDRAVELLEQGRGVLLGQTLDTRSDLGRLTAEHPETAAEFVRIRDALDRPDLGGAPDEIIERRHALARRWDETLAAIRRLDGYADFLLPRTSAELCAAARQGPIVFVTQNDRRADALIMLPDGVRPVPLPEATAAETGRRISDLYGALAVAIAPGGSLRERARAERDLRDVLGWLERAVTGPVLAELPPDVSRLWWVPTGLMVFLPLHSTEHGSIVPSYTPTVRVLEHAREQQAGATVSEGVASEGGLVVSAAAAVDGLPLPGAAGDAETLAGLLPGARVLRDAEATRANVLAALPGAPLAHFACHAVSDPSAPALSRLMLHDEPLTLPDVGGLNLAGGRLAFLAACTTALGAIDLPDEAVHLTSAFQLAGYAHVVGTLWPADDRTATAVTRGFYRRLAAGRPVHAALAETVADVRAESPKTPSLWASYVHVGP
ncbi:CHAT domain-containing protein [Actinomadura chibensis]|uniref:CHAT domain-containing protein n=1 Tax=Actinomadura chibensis TaxID=392828 RepID=A0A5D0NM33_9ACTN|nr:CHAT domain-containing protein [Actinomadura chibensis]TYB45527.1 CHAT domain-containing protein [Actinomadura chibensis]